MIRSLGHIICQTFDYDILIQSFPDAINQGMPREFLTGGGSIHTIC